jgi:hypothetical protein
MLRRWIFALFGSSRAVGITLLYLLATVAVRLVIEIAFFSGDITWGGEGGMRDEVVIGVLWGLTMSPLLHPAMAVRRGVEPKTSEEAPATDT